MSVNVMSLTVRKISSKSLLFKKSISVFQEICKKGKVLQDIKEQLKKEAKNDVKEGKSAKLLSPELTRRRKKYRKEEVYFLLT